MGIQNIYVLRSDGTLIFSKDYHSIKEDAVVVSGFLSAIDTFAKSIGAGKQVQKIITDEFQFVGKSSKKYGIKYVVICDKDDSTEQVESLLTSMNKSFLIKYNKLLNSKNPYVDMDQFKDWSKNLDKLIEKSDLSSFSTVVSKTMKDLKNIFKKIEDL
ncbi:MAG: hypothetical protein EU549_02680 [Promethearchaeota archaeon]|nr:MAG: hypothetical protein EU549_02680 [Candidatus Lokiarchaeota archaeon]